MLRGVYAPSDFESIDSDPAIPAAVKLAVIHAARVRVTQSEFRDNFGGPFDLELPFRVRASFDLCTHTDGQPLEQPYLSGERIDVSDEALYRNGLGTRLIKSAVRYGLLLEPRLQVFSTGWARLGLLNSVVKIFGEDSVAVMHGDNRYGWNGNVPLDAIFDDLPPRAGQPYLIPAMEAAVNPEIALGWELPIVDHS